VSIRRIWIKWLPRPACAQGRQDHVCRPRLRPGGNRGARVLHAAFLAQTNPNGQNNWATAGAVTLNEQFTAPMFPSVSTAPTSPPATTSPRATGTGTSTPPAPMAGPSMSPTGRRQCQRPHVCEQQRHVTTGKNLKDKDTRHHHPQGRAGPVDTLYTDAPLSSLPTSFAAATGPKDNGRSTPAPPPPTTRPPTPCLIKGGTGIDAAPPQAWSSSGRRSTGSRPAHHTRHRRSVKGPVSRIGAFTRVWCVTGPGYARSMTDTTQARSPVSASPPGPAAT
jgi:hypothetical protein